MTKDAQGKEKKEVVRSLDEIIAINQRIDRERQERKDADARWEARHPELELLRESFGQFKAWKMSELLAQMREQGRDTVAATMKKSSWYRFTKELREIGIELPE